MKLKSSSLCSDAILIFFYMCGGVPPAAFAAGVFVRHLTPLWFP